MEEYREGSQHLHCRLGTKGFIFLFARKGASALMQACGFLLGRNDDFPRRNPIDTTSTPEEKTMEIVQFLISKGADPTLRDALHMTALHFAVLQPHVPLVKLLIEAGASVDALDCEGRTPLHYVSRCDDNVDGKDLKDIICLLCKTRDLEFSHDLLTKPVVRPLEAYKEEKEGMRPGHIRKITLQGSHPSSDQVKDNSCTPLEIALLSSRWKVANVLMSLGAPFPTDIDLMTVMDNAIKELDVNAVELLLRNGVNAANRSLMTLIRAFIHHKKDQKRKREPAKDLETRLISILRVIIPAGADVNFTETNQGSSDEEEAEIMNREAEDGSGDDEDSDSDSSDETEPCIKDGPKVSTPMNLAASITGSQSILKELVLFGADTYGFSSHAFDPILNAAVYGDSQDLKFLLDHALSHPNESHWSRFLGNIQEGDDAVVHVCYCLEKAGALNIKNFQGRTLLHLAVEQGNEKLLRSLILHGARVDILDNQRACAMQCAASSRQAHIFATLLLAKHKTSPK
jgi:ankyrin repeat protein